MYAFLKCGRFLVGRQEPQESGFLLVLESNIRSSVFPAYLSKIFTLDVCPGEKKKKRVRHRVANMGMRCFFR